MDATVTPTSRLVGEAPPSPAGPVDGTTFRALQRPPIVQMSSALQVLRFQQRQIQFVFRCRREYGETFRLKRAVVAGQPVVTSHPDHVRSLFTNPDIAPSLTGESPLRPIVGPSSVLTSLGPTHMRQRKLLLPAFHGDAVEAYRQVITDITNRTIDELPLGRPVRLAPRMGVLTLDVIMAGIFGIDDVPPRGTPERTLRNATNAVIQLSTKRVGQLAELMNIGHDEPFGLSKPPVAVLDRAIHAVIAKRRREDGLGERNDILSVLLRARTEDGEPLTDSELRDQMITLILAGHETTANSLAWAWERLVRHPQAHDRLRDAVRSDTDAEAEVDAVIHEAMRCRPVVPIIGRRVGQPWQLGDYGIEANNAITVSILLLHHREDLYPDPFAFRPERWIGHRPGTYEWIPFGGGIRRCLGATLAMVEQRIVLDAMARRLDISAVDPDPERAVHRNVTMIPSQGARVIVHSRT